MNSPNLPSKRPPFPLVIDNTLRSALVACPQKAFWEYFEHHKPIRQSVHLVAGAAWARGLEVAREAFYIRGASAASAQAEGLLAMIAAYGSFECPPDSAKSINRLSEAFVYYFLQFPLETDPAQPFVGPNGPMIEFSFALPLWDEEAAAEGRTSGRDPPPPLLHPETGEPIIYAGRADMVATYAGAVTIYDDKTTSSIGATWADQWDMRGQFSGYCWAAQELGIPVTQVLVRGIAILKTKFSHAEALSYREEWRINRWRLQVVRDTHRAIEMWKSGQWDTNEAESCSSYGGCMFKQPCMAQDPTPWLEANFVRRKWDPVSRTETLLEGPSE